ncbi:MAG TPA: hypothetical protein VJB66_00200 [Candidatus Nanoarchaeia archaeon]|nr:hypothetical protein [Candidatus Nanoarchaeia archaeon]
MFGFYEMLSNYTREKEIKSLEAELRKIELKNELNKYNELHKQQAQATLHKMRGKAPRKTTDEERAKTREFVFQEFEQKFKKP